MRIITGSAKGHKIKVPRGRKIRPAKDSVRQAVFSMLYGLVENARVLDLFAGSGAFGLEALSRGAEHVTFVDIDKRCTETIKENLRTMDFEEKGEVIKMDAQKFISDFLKRHSELGSESNKVYNKIPKQVRDDTKFNLVFLDPPYEMSTQVHLLKSLAEILAPQGVIIFSHAKETEIPEEIDGLKLIRERSYGATTVSFLAKT